MSLLVWGLLDCSFLCGWALGDPRTPHSLPPLATEAEPGSGSLRMLPPGDEAALAFLYSGDAQQLSGANCTQRSEAQGAEDRPGLPPILQRAAGTLAQAANFLNMLLQANDIRESSVEEDVEWYQALVRSVAEGDLRAYRALLTFNPPPGARHLPLALQAVRVGEETILQDLSGNRMREEDNLDGWALQKRVLINDLRSLNSPKWPRGDGYVGGIEQVSLSPPFLECQDGHLRPAWLVTLSATFYGLKPDLSPEVRGQVQMDIDLQSVDINQCESGPGWYSNTHLCDLNSTQCVPLENQGFVLGRYVCRCRPGFYGTSGSVGLKENATQTGQFGSLQGNLGKLLRCHPCPVGCTSCSDATPCLVEEVLALRTAVMACQACCMLTIFLGMLVAYRCRRSKRIRASGVVLLEAILFGSLLLYFPVFILYFKPSVFRCISLRWVRLLGFTVVYGTIVLKLYRVLQLFLSRTAQRGVHPSNGQLLRHLGLLLLLVLGFLVVWTAGVLEQGIQHSPLVTQGHTATGRHFYLCHHDLWDYIMAMAELLLLCWGSFLCYATRAVPSAFHEQRYMSIALHNELLFSAAFHAARFMLVPSLHPDWTILLFFLHTHSTVTATLALIFIPKFWKPGASPREEVLEELYEDELDLQCSGSYLNSSIASAWSERSLDPGDIRAELKKLYAQLEVHKNKEMSANNPHLPKKRGGSCQGLGRSFMRRLAEFPEALSRQHSKDSGSLGGSSLPGSSRHRLLSSSLQEAEGPPALRTTRSTCDQRREQDPPLLDSVLRRNLSKKASPWEGQESGAGPPPLGFRSASAHNLMVGERLPRARPSSLQKSLSVVSGSREKALLVASQAYLEESYRQAKDREERKKAEAAIVSPVRRPSTRRLERPPVSALSAPPSPAKGSSLDSSPGRLRQEAGRRLPHPPIRHQVSTPILALSGPCLGEPRMLSPTSTLAPVLWPAPASTPAPILTPVPVAPQSPGLLTFICPWENAELPVKKENVSPEGSSGPERGHPSPAPARAKLWRALSVAVEKRGAGEREMDPEGGRVQGEAGEVEEDKPKFFLKSHSLKTPMQQGSMRSLGLAIKALTRSRSTYREKEGGGDSPEHQEDTAAGAGVGAPPRSPRLGRPKAVSKQAALPPRDDEESLQNQQNAHTSRMLQAGHQEGSRGQEDRGKRSSQGQGERKVERTGKIGLATLRQVFGDKNAEQAKEATVRCHELPKAGLQPLGGVERRVAEVCPWKVTEAEVCPWEVTESEMGQTDSSIKAKICPWEDTEGDSERKASRQDLRSPQQEGGKAPEKSEHKGVVVIIRKEPERPVRSREAVCPWESLDAAGLSTQSAPPDSDRSHGRSEVMSNGELKKAEKHPGEASDPEACLPNTAKAELCPWEVTGGEEGTPVQRRMEFSRERQRALEKAAFWPQQNLGRDLTALCPWESTDFRDPSAVSLQTPGSSGSLSSSVVEGCPREVGDTGAGRKAEVYPRELSDELIGKDTLSQGVSGDSLQEKVSRKECLGEMREQAMKSMLTVSPEKESVCPWENTSPAQPGPCPESSSSKAGEQLPSSGASRAMQVCPWEVLEPEGKQATLAMAEICPWEVAERTEDWTSGQTPKGGEAHKDTETKSGKVRTQDVTMWEKPEEQIQKQEAICPRESADPGAERARATPQRLGDTGHKAVAIGPRDSEEPDEKVGTGAGRGRAVGVETAGKSPDDTGQTSADSGPGKTAASVQRKPETPALEQGLACPRDSLGAGGSPQHSDTLDTDGSKAVLRVRSRPAEVCPWEVNKGPAGKAPEQDAGNTSAAQREQTLEKGPLASPGGISKRESKSHQEREVTHPWDGKDVGDPAAQAPKVADLPSGPSTQAAEGRFLEASEEATEMGDVRQDPNTGSLSERTAQRKAPTSKAEFPTEDREQTSNQWPSVCPREATVTAGSSSYWDNQCPGQPRTNSQTSVRAGVRAAEVRPWDAPDLNVDQSDSGTEFQIYSWEVTGGIQEKVMSRQDEKRDSQEEERTSEKPELIGVAIEKTPQTSNFRMQEGVCSTQDFGGLSLQAGPRASYESKGGSEVAGCAEARRAEACPGEAEEAPSAKKGEMCQWEVSAGAAGEGGQGDVITPKVGSGGAEGCFFKAAVKFSSQKETVCPREGTGAAGPFPQREMLDTDGPKVSPHQASNTGTMAEPCQWEVTDPEGNTIKGTMADICPWEETRTLSEESGLPALPAIRRDVPIAPEKSFCFSVHRPLESSLPEGKSPHFEVREPPSTFPLEGVREQEPLGVEPKAKLTLELNLQTVGQKSFSLTEDQQGSSEAQDEELGPLSAYPWDWE